MTFFLFFSLVSWALNPPWVSFCFSLYSLAWFPSICSIFTLPQWLALSVLLHVSLVYLCSLLIGLRQAQFFWPLVPCPGFSFPREWTNLWINAFAVSPFCSTLDTYILANLADTTEISAVQLLASQLPRCINNPATCLHQHTPMYHCVTVQSHPWTLSVSWCSHCRVLEGSYCLSTNIVIDCSTLSIPSFEWMNK